MPLAPAARRLLVVFIGAGLLSVPAAAAYGQCVVFENPAELYRVNQAVFVATVVTTEAAGGQGHHAITDVATLRVERSWKGRVAREVRVGSDRPFEVGTKYVVFASGRPLTSSILCRAAEPVAAAKKKMAWLARRRSVVPRKAP